MIKADPADVDISEIGPVCPDGFPEEPEVNRSGRRITVERKTKETEIRLTLDLSGGREVSIHSGVPFLDHMLTSMAFHGGFGLEITGSGDTQIDLHHLTEDTGIVLGKAFADAIPPDRGFRRFGHAVIPMDEALCEAAVDVSGRPFIALQASFPQPVCGTFDMALLTEFFRAFAHNGGITMHLICRSGDNSHHIAEALFKSLGKALAFAYTPSERGEPLPSIKGTL